MTLPVKFKSALGQLVDDVQAYFDAIGCKAALSMGWRERTKQSNQGPGGANRVVFTPSDDDGGGGGLSLEHLKPGPRDVVDQSNPPVVVARWRPLFTWDQTVVISVWAHDDSQSVGHLTYERLQYEAVNDLRDKVIQGIKRSAVGAGNIAWEKVRFTYAVKGADAPPVELRNGLELRIWLELRSPIPDRIQEVAYPASQTVTKDLEQNTTPPVLTAPLSF